MSLPLIVLYISIVFLHKIFISASANDHCQIQQYDMSCSTFLKQVQNESNAADADISLMSDARFARYQSLSSENCYVLVKKKMTYDDANQVCTKANGRLAWPENTDQARALYDSTSFEFDPANRPDVWIGMTLKTELSMSNNTNNTSNTTNTSNSTNINNTSNANNTNNANNTSIANNTSNARNNAIVWDCGHASLRDRDIAVDLSTTCFQRSPDMKKNGSASLCKDTGTGTLPNQPCYCWSDPGDELPFYCQIKSVCKLLPVKSCNEFVQFLWDEGVRSVNWLPPTATSLLEDSCYALVAENMTWEGAKNMCSNAGGRLAWLPYQTNSSQFIRGVVELTEHAYTNGFSQTWIGLKQWDIPNSTWSVNQWQCPTEGQNVQWSVIDNGTGIIDPSNITQPWWWTDFPNASLLNDSDLLNGYLEKRTDGLTALGFDSANSLSLPFFCERPLIPKTTFTTTFAVTNLPPRTHPPRPPRPRTARPPPGRGTTAAPQGPDPQKSTTVIGDPGDGVGGSVTVEDDSGIYIVLGVALILLILILLVVYYIMRPRSDSNLDDYFEAHNKSNEITGSSHDASVPSSSKGTSTGKEETSTDSKKTEETDGTASTSASEDKSADTSGDVSDTSGDSKSEGTGESEASGDTSSKSEAQSEDTSRGTDDSVKGE